MMARPISAFCFVLILCVFCCSAEKDGSGAGAATDAAKGKESTSAKTDGTTGTTTEKSTAGAAEKATTASGTTTGGTQIASTGAHSTSTERPAVCLKMEVTKETYIPSEPAVVSCNNACGKNCLKSPSLQSLIAKNLKVEVQKRNANCTTTMEMYVTSFKWNRNSILVECEVKDEIEMKTVIFQKRKFSEPCVNDYDCWGVQWCKNSTCRCPDDKPVFVDILDDCFKAAPLGERCTHEKQCRLQDPKSRCKNGTCLCQSNYFQDSNNTCTVSGAVVVSTLSRTMLTFVVVCATSLAGLRT